MDHQRSYEVLEELLSAFSAECVEQIISQENFSDEDWQPYGGRPKNWDTISNQQTSAVGALTM